MDYLVKLRNGDEQGLKHFHKVYYQYLYYYAVTIIRNQQEAEDIAQVAIARLWEHRHTIQNTVSVKPFLFTIVKNLCLNYLRRKKREERSIKNQPAPEPEYLAWRNNENRVEIMEMLGADIGKLTPRQQEIFNLIIKGLSNREIAAQLNIKEQTVRSQYHNIIQWMKEQVQLYLSGDE